MFRDLERGHTAFSGVAAHVSFDANLAYHSQALHGNGMLVSGSYFPVLGLKSALGRLLAPIDDQTVGADFVAVLSYDYWATQLGSDPAVLNQPILINGQSMTIVGVAPKRFEGTTLGVKPKVFVPITMRGLVSPGFHGFEDRQSNWVYLFARLSPGVSIEQAGLAVNAVYHRVINNVDAPLVTGIDDKTLAQFRGKQIALEDDRRGQSLVRGLASTPFALLLAITGVVVLIACVDIANLLLARAAARATDISVRLALGASRRQLMTMPLTESCVLAVLAGVASLVVAHWTLALVTTLLPPEAVAMLHLSLSVEAILFTAALSIGTGLLFGLVPAVHSTRPDLASAIRAGSPKQSGARGATRLRTSLLTVQIALSMTLLILAGLFLRSVLNVSRLDLGMDAHNVVTFGISPELNGYSPARSKMLFSRVQEELAAIPDVVGVAVSKVPILSANGTQRGVNVEGFKAGPDGNIGARLNEVSAGYFSVIGTPLLAGREFNLADGAGAPKVAIVNEAFAKKFHLGREAVGKHMTAGPGTALDVEIVGLAEDAKYDDVKDHAPPQYFTPYRQDTTLGAINFYVRMATGPDGLLRAIPSVIKELDPGLPVQHLKTLPQQAKVNVLLDRMISTLSTAFAMLATLLAAVGLYGVVAYSVAQRTKEIGVRMALGADGSRVRRMVLRQVGLMTLLGGAIGIAAALALERAAGSLLYEMQGDDPVVVAAAAVLITLVSFGAAYIPARRASKIDAMQALRYE